MRFFDILRKKITGEDVLAGCGHEFKKTDRITAFGKSIQCTIPVVDGKAEYCHRCLEKMAIRCAWCGEPIFIGDPITLYTPLNEHFLIPEHAVVYNKHLRLVYSEIPLQFVGCFLWDCAESGADRAGFWYPPGEVHRVLSPLEKAFQGGEMVIVENLCDYSEAIRA